MKLKPIYKIKSKGEARQIAIDYQNWQSEQSLSYSELAKYNRYFMQLGKKFNLIKEFEENAII